MNISLNKIDIAILCGGLGKRLRPVIGESQKVMAEVNDEPFLNILLKNIVRQGGRRVILLTGYKAELVEEYYRKNDFGLKIELSREKEPLGTGGALKNAQSLIKSDPFMMMNGDSFCPMDYAKLLEFYNKKQARAVIAIKKLKESQDFGVISINAQNEITSFQEKVQKQEAYTNAGVYGFSQEIFSLMPAQPKFSIEQNFFPKLVGKKIFGFKVQKGFIDVGIPERYRQAQKILRNK
ncbi:MAG: hypothetical protein A3D10_09140 [Omnitrophica WOR_2 bacterium RIFCSPHIGHO2_02_FULL_48_11]|nr:MAG: hypothetical protein A3D10_09140 [Omnitrophica WOR_2 bacterium RIFCSPHIGHO2_02_FULL_48_11]